MNRRDRILEGIDIATQTGLEIGPLHDPVVSKDQGRILYVDHCSTEELRKKYEGQIAGPQIRDVDYVWNGGELADVVGVHCPFDYVIASHVMEHVPDLLGWLHQIARVLRPRGLLAIAIPDRRFTFDFLRPTSTPGEVLDAYFRKATVPTTKHLYDNYTLACQVDKTAAWLRQIESSKLNRLHPPGLAMSFVRRALEQHEYIDCHCWVFTPKSFMEIADQLSQENLFPFTVSRFVETQYDELEFFVTLRNNA